MSAPPAKTASPVPRCFSLEVDGLVQRFLALIEEFNEVLKTAKRLKHLGTGLAVFAGGTHLDGFKQGVTRTINDYARSKGILKEKDSNLSGDDTREGCCPFLSRFPCCERNR